MTLVRNLKTMMVELQIKLFFTLQNMLHLILLLWSENICYSDI